MKGIIAILAAALLAVPSDGFFIGRDNGVRIIGGCTEAGCDYSEERDVNSFSSLSTSGPYNVYYVQSPTSRVVIEGKKEFVEKLITEVKGGNLNVRLQDGTYRGLVLKVTVYSPVLDGIRISGSGSFIAGRTVVPIELKEAADALSEAGKTPLFFAADSRLLGVIAVADTLKPDSAQAIAELQSMGIRVVMLTGDNERTAAAIGRRSGVDEVIAGVLPEGKERAIRSLQQKGSVAMVGDGINDAPVLARSDVGVAMGALGSDAAVEAADVVLMDDQPHKIATAIALARRTRRIASQNIVFAIVVKVLVLLLSAFGVAQMGLVVFADVGVMVLAVLNAMRASNVNLSSVS